MRIILSVLLISMLCLNNNSFGQTEQNVKKLPSPERDKGMALMKALDNRHSSRSFSEKDIPDQVLSNLLWAAFGINRDNGKRTAPSSRNIQDIEIFVAKKDGLYQYIADKHGLKKKLNKDIRDKTGKQNFVTDAPINLVYVSNHNKVEQGSPSKFTQGVNTGVIVQNVYLYCASEGLSCVVRGYVDKAALREAMKLEDYKHITLSHTIGYPPE